MLLSTNLIQVIDEQLKTFKLNISYPQGVDLKIIAPEGYAAEIKGTDLQQE